MTSHRFRNLLCVNVGTIAFTTWIAACSPIAKTPTSMSSATPATTEMNHGKMNSAMNHSMDLGPADENYDLRFIDAMIFHHEGAVVMAKDALQKSKRPELKKLATEIISAQTQEVAQMKAWRTDWYPKSPNTPMAWQSTMNHMMDMSSEQISAMRMDLDLGAADAGYELRFIKAMIPHHEAAIVMANDLSSKTQRPKLKKLAKAIIISQQAEIDQMKQWSKDYETSSTRR